jgi:hypothetical protein
MVDDFLLRLVRSALERSNHKDYQTSSLLTEAKRIATLLTDTPTLWWIRQELEGDLNGTIRLIDNEFKQKFVFAEYKQLSITYSEVWIRERTITEYASDGSIVRKDGVFPCNIYDIESRISSLSQNHQMLPSTTNMHTLDAYFVERENTKAHTLLYLMTEQFKSIEAKIRDRVANYLINVEAQLMQGNILSRYFQQNIDFVTAELCKYNEDFKSHFEAIDNHLIRKTPIDYSEALLDIRRVMSLFADVVCPSQSNPVICSDGKKRSLNKDKYLNRISYTLFEKCGKHSSTELLNDNLSDLVTRIEKINILSCKGVHDDVSEMEARQCVIQMYAILGDLIRLTLIKQVDD